jgi:hypothetical protein
MHAAVSRAGFRPAADYSTALDNMLSSKYYENEEVAQEYNA